MNILIICGSLRKGSFNHKLADAAMHALEKKPDNKVLWLDYSDLPVLNMDHAYPFSDAEQSARGVVRDADALWIFTPEYNGGIPGGLKNLLDVVSLSWKPNDFSSGTPLMGKPVTTSGAGGKGGTAMAQKELAALLERCGCKVMKEPVTMIKLPPEVHAGADWQPSEQDLQEIDQQAQAFEKFVCQTLGIHR